MHLFSAVLLMASSYQFHGFSGRHLFTAAKFFVLCCWNLILNLILQCEIAFIIYRSYAYHAYHQRSYTACCLGHGTSLPCHGKMVSGLNAKWTLSIIQKFLPVFQLFVGDIHPVRMEEAVEHPTPAHAQLDGLEPGAEQVQVNICMCRYHY